MMEIILLSILTIIIVYLLRIYLRNHYNFWDDRGVPSNIKPYPLLGSFTDSLFPAKPFHEVVLDIYKKFPKASCMGFFQLTQPTLLLRDPNLIKEINVKVFDNFTDRSAVFSDEQDIFGRNLFALKGEKWKNMRSTLSPAFTSSKMRMMINLMNDCAQNLVKFVTKEVEKNNGKIVTVEMKDTVTRYTNDVISNTAFGIECNSFENKENEIFIAGKKVTNFSRWTFLKSLFIMLAPKIAKFFDMSFFEKAVTNFFRDTINTNVKIREEKGIVRPDMLHLLIQARKRQLEHEDIVEDAGFATVEESNVGKSNINVMTDEDIVAQAFLFFFAGYETSAVAMSLMAYELVVNTDIQKKLQEEIDETLEQSNGKVDYDIVRSMKYLDMVVSETLRKWPTVVFTERVCHSPYVIKDEDGMEIKVEKGVSIWAAVYGLHRDPKYFPEPERFDPERFNNENKNNIVPFSYLPFGVGPRNCIGSRFALLELKLLFIRLLEKFDMVVVKETQIPLKFDKTKFNFIAENGLWVGLKPRSKNH